MSSNNFVGSITANRGSGRGSGRGIANGRGRRNSSGNQQPPPTRAYSKWSNSDRDKIIDHMAARPNINVIICTCIAMYLDIIHNII